MEAVSVKGRDDVTRDVTCVTSFHIDRSSVTCSNGSGPMNAAKQDVMNGALDCFTGGPGSIPAIGNSIVQYSNGFLSA